MVFWEFMTVMVVFGSVFGYLRSLNASADKKRLAELEARIAALEGGAQLDALTQRIDVIEEIVVGDDLSLQRRIERVAREDPLAAPRR